MADANFYSSWYVRIYNVDDTFVDFLQSVFLQRSEAGKPLRLFGQLSNAKEKHSIIIPSSALSIFKYNPENSRADLMFENKDSIHLTAAREGLVELPNGCSLVTGVLAPLSDI